jgi:hypothetical protein
MILFFKGKLENNWKIIDYWSGELVDLKGIDSIEKVLWISHYLLVVCNNSAEKLLE